MKHFIPLSFQKGHISKERVCNVHTYTLYTCTPAHASLLSGIDASLSSQQQNPTYLTPEIGYVLSKRYKKAIKHRYLFDLSTIKQRIATPACVLTYLHTIDLLY